MQILSVALKNFKSHSDREFSFQLGTNAICGENGAGKSSILEAIAWTLFNHTGAYNKEDLIRNGASSAQVIVRFVSDRDGRTYEVQRCTTKGYTVYDPQLSVKLDHKLISEEVMPWLRQQFNVAPGTDLGRLFANTIGVPQGTFTAAFLDTTENRRKIFDSILKVEEYKSLHRDLKPLEDYAKAEVEQLERKIIDCEETLQDWETVKQRRSTLHDAIAQDQATLTQLQTELAQLQQEKDKLAAQAQLVQQLGIELEKASAQVEGKRQANQVLSQSLDRAQQAVAICKDKRSSYQAVQRAEAELQTLDQQVKQRQQLQKSRDAQQQALSDRRSELTKLTLQLDQLAQAETEIATLQPTIQRQQELEQQQQAAIEQLQQLQAAQREQQTAAKQFTKLQKDLDRLSKEIGRIEQLEAQVEQLPNLEQQRDRLQAQIIRIEAARQFELELRQLFTTASQQRDRQQDAASQAAATLWQLRQQFPQATTALDTVMTTLQSEVKLNNTLLESLQGILTDLSQQTAIDQLQQQLKTISRQLDTTRKQKSEVDTLPTLQTQENYLRQETLALQMRQQELQAAFN
jgi:exonuclease SbcC